MGCGGSTQKPLRATEYEPIEKPKKQLAPPGLARQMSEDDAATKIGAMYRGKKDRRQVEERRSAAERVSARWEPDMEGAAQTIGASVKGRLARKELEEQSRAATIVQSRVRGKAARRATERMAAEHVINTETAKLKRTKSNSKVLKVNEYNMGKELGKGAFGQVWKATKGKKEDEQVAIKML